VTDANGNTVGTAGEVIAIGANDQASTIAATINALDSALGLEATATNSAVFGSLSAALGATSFTLEGTTISATITDAQDLTVLKDAVNAKAATTGITASFADTTDKGELTFTAADGRDIALDGLNTVTNTDTISFGGVQLVESGGQDGAVAVGSVAVTSTKGSIALAETSTSEVVTGGTQSSSLDSVDNVDLATSAATAAASLSVLDAAIAQVSAGRSDLGAIQNRFESVISSLQVASENAEASRSRIQDADFASETANLTKSQILTQAGISVLAQANAQPQQVLALLQ
jgi:flagellin